MKPFVLFFGLTCPLLGAWQTASAQPPTANSVQPATVYSVQPFAIDSALPPTLDRRWNSHPAFWPIAAKPAAPLQLSELPEGHLWQDYRGGAVEHDFRLMPAPARHRPSGPPRSFLSALGGWFDNLTTRLSPHVQAPCESCAATAGVQPPQFSVEPIPEVHPHLAPGPSILKPARDRTLEDDTFPPIPGRSVPKPESKVPPIIPVPPEVDRSRPPVVELAPDIVPPPLPAAPTPPRNRIPVPGSLPPRNTIPR